jgi:hypothetical protein
MGQEQLATNNTAALHHEGQKTAYTDRGGAYRNFRPGVKVKIKDLYFHWTVSILLAK